MSRNEQILYAAERCMRQKGFHQASIQNIAAEAGVSIGLIYKYYRNKEAIIEALVVMTVQRLKMLIDKDFERLSLAGSQQHELHDMVTPEVESNIALLMEVSSEATRNPVIQNIVVDAWHQLKANFIVQEKAQYPERSTPSIHARLYIMSLIIDGIIIRRCMKQGEITADVMTFYNSVLNTLYKHSAA